METSANHSMMEILPDEILLEVCKYLLCNDILYSFVGLNSRMTQMITQYRHYVSLHKASISNFYYLSINVFPQIGDQIRSLFIDCCYSVLQDELFIQYFGDKMSMIFPQLERVSLMSYQEDQLIAFLRTLHDLDHLVEIRLYDLFTIEKLHRQTVVRSLFQANNQTLTTILIDSESSPLTFSKSDYYLNTRRLRIVLGNIEDLRCLFAAVPNVHYLDVVINEQDPPLTHVDKMNFSTLCYLTNFRLKCIRRMWKLEELSAILMRLPIIHDLSLFLSTRDIRLIQSDVVLSLSSSTVKKLNYAICLHTATTHETVVTIVTAWPISHPVRCYYKKRFFLIHTLPWNFGDMEVSSSVSNSISSYINSEADYNKQVKQLDIMIDKNFSFSKSLTVVSQNCGVKKINIHISNNSDDTKEEQPATFHCTQLSRLLQVWFTGLIPPDLKHFSSIVNASPNLFRLDLPFNFLLKLFEDQRMCQLLDQRITSLCIEKNFDSSLPVFTEEHMPLITSKFSRLRDIYVDLTHLPCSTNIDMIEDIFQGSLVQNLFDSSDQQKYEMLSPGTSESALSCLLRNFKEHKLIGLCVDGQFIEEIKTDAEQWLRTNTILSEQPFKAIFYSQLERLLIWM